MRLPLHLLWHCFAAAPPPVHVDVHLLPARAHVTRASVWLVGVEDDGHDPATRARLAQRIEDMASPSDATTRIVFTPISVLFEKNVRHRTDVVRASPLLQTPDGAWHGTPDADYVYVYTDEQDRL